MNSQELCNIFANFGFNVIPDPVFGSIIEMDAENAFLFSATTGAKYLFYNNGITMKGRSEIFIHRAIFSDNHLIYSPGMFSRTPDGNLAEGNSANNLLRKYPQVFTKKKVIIYDLNPNSTSNVENAVYTAIQFHRRNPADYLLYKNSMSNDVGESLQEYFASLVFINKGYLVENQTPWFQQNYHFNGRTLQGGIPDFSAFHSDISNLLYKYSFITHNRGISLLLLPVIKLFRTNLFTAQKPTTPYKHELLIGEAKTSSSSLPQALKQLDKYNAVHIADELFTIIPDSRSNPKYGSMYIANGRVVFNSKNRAPLSDERTQIDAAWIDTYIKMLLLGNIGFDRIIDFINNFRQNNNLPLKDSYECTHLLDAVQNTTNDDFMSLMQEEF